MKPSGVDNLDTVEIVMAIEEAFEVDLSDGNVDSFASARELVDWLEVRLSNQRPNKAARAFLRQLAHDKQRPELAEGLDGPWRREQIAAIVREFSQ